ncbi:beta family protein [Isoptericola sp. NPDC057191]|uniref:beta family protein n=1 Tax=Isoptericola sp. NPDC057191 TaxID=3346041 RepID=UPI00362A09B4
MPTRPTYFPALKTKQGELTALEHVPDEQRTNTVPILDLDYEEGEALGGRTTSKLTTILERAWAGGRLVLDATAADASTDGTDQYRTLLEKLRPTDVAVVPAASVASSADFLAMLGDTHRTDNNGVCIRLTSEELAAGVAADLDTTLGRLGLQPEDVDLVIDFGQTDEVSMSLHAAILRLALPSVPYLDRWRHLVVLSGAFPASLSNPRKTVSIVRADSGLWRQVTSDRTIARVLDYGDYGVTHPAAAAPTGGFRSAPNVRYTQDDVWTTMKWTLRPDEGHDGMYDVARTLRDAGVFDAPSFSWGDAELHRRADRDGGPGGGAQWKAWSTSHHLAKVNARLSSLGEP